MRKVFYIISHKSSEKSKQVQNFKSQKHRSMQYNLCFVFGTKDDTKGNWVKIDQDHLSLPTMMSKKMLKNCSHNEKKHINLHLFFLKITKMTSILQYEKVYYHDVS